MVLTEHTLTEWARLAADAYKAGHTMIGDKFSTARTCPAGSRLPIREFDALQAVYCGWLALGWARALEVWAEQFPTAPVYSQPEPLPASPVKDTPAFGVGDTVRVISPELHQADMRHYPGNEGIVCDVLPDVRKRYVYVCAGLGSWFEDQIELVSRAPTSPVDSVGEDEESNGPFYSAETVRRLEASHAAHLAKIQALTEALEGFLAATDEPEVCCRAQVHGARVAARAARALPCAPLGS